MRPSAPVRPVPGRAAASPRAALAAGCAAVLLSGCAGSGAVSVPAPTPDAAAAALCAQLVAALPEALDERPRVPVSPESELVAAYSQSPGAPAVAVRCGVPRPPDLRPESELWVMNEVSWLPQPAGAPTQFTAVGFGAYVEAIVPPSEDEPQAVLVPLSDAITANLPPLEPGAL
ncbi:DUF3515 family protein [Allonocardiopsis opalescens]|uniref:Uncharacterized protein DUF3515 n=1 Tax=Allonocardiopsis opalescens TaxID=1144618 RepID=A0A2T0PVS8_9ACTN|nr:DUF3515 family protein [Allonocardiopsis opalescens]PRX95646.1 uncharacterized protein DUF3515 [Allonocardiopsis opalescens]